ncbi:uncharacterized protein LOC126746587 [Anthonomus grandis grandis]|uniref:uncharacterized protein LOC126746587 n=1 Tax=Anthonomus grandis grandis TaxID=2921223 RepID=UPI00216668E9|nr:uncharacterized protein LOC126746587 [Anthonomus grandis grandis]
MCDTDIIEKLDFSSAKVQTQHRQISNIFLTLLLSALSCFLFTAQAIIFSFFRKTVDIYLKFKYEQNYGGLVANEDLPFLVTDKSQCCITVITFSRTNKEVNMLERIKEILQKKIFDHPDHYPKLTSTVHQFLGYFYTIKNECNVNDVVKAINIENNEDFTENYLKSYAGKVMAKDFAKNGSLLWDIHVVLYPIKFKSNEGYCYPVISRFHHSIADGTSLVSLFIQLYAENSNENYNKEIFQKLLGNQTNKKMSKSFLDLIARFFKLATLYLEILFISFGRIIETNQLKPNDINALHGTNYTGEKLCAWTSERKTECIPLVKNIKNKTKTKFSCVVCTAIAASLSHYFKRNNFPIPEYISGAIAVLLDYPDVDLSKPIELRNKTGGNAFELPMIYGSTTLVEALKNVSNAWNKQMRQADGLLVAFLMRNMLQMPIQILKILFGWTSHTYVLTNVPGSTVLKTKDGYFEKVIPFAPIAQGIGISIAIISYDEKFQIGILIEKSLVNSQEEVQKIADDILLYIKLLDKQVQKLAYLVVLVGMNIFILRRRIVMMFVEKMMISDKDIKEKLDFSTVRIQRQHWQISNVCCIILLNAISFIGFMGVAIIFLIFRKIIDIYLKFKYKKDYEGLVASEDLAFLVPDKPQCCIGITIYFKSIEELNMFQKIKEILQEKVFNHPDHYPKLICKVHQFFGYFYKIKDRRCTADDVVRSITIENSQDLTEDYLKSYAGEIITKKFEKTESLLWDVHVAPCPMKHILHEGLVYPVIFRFNHSIADGTSLISLLIQLFGDKSTTNYSKKLFKKTLNTQTYGKQHKSFMDLIIIYITKTIKMLLFYMEVIFLSFGRNIMMNQVKPHDINALHRTNYSNEQFCAWASEEKVECIPLVKNIKNRQNTNFNSVISTAVAASLSHYFKRNNFPIPEYMSGAIAVLPEYPDVDIFKPAKLRNKAGGVVFELPMIYGSTTLAETLKNVSDEWNRQMRQADTLLVSFLMRNMFTMPIQILRMLFGWTSQTYILSNIPGSGIIKRTNEWFCDKVILVAPIGLGIGISFAILSYDQKFQIAVMIDKSLINSQEETQKIADDVLLYIKLLDKELQTYINLEAVYREFIKDFSIRETGSVDNKKHEMDNLVVNEASEVAIILYYLYQPCLSMFLSVIIVAFTPLLWLFFLLICFAFWTYRKIVDIILRVKLGAKYGGLLNYSDGFSVYESNYNFHISCIGIHNSEKEVNLVEVYKQRFKAEVVDNADVYSKLTGTMHNYLGYCYWLKNTIDLEKYIQLLPVPKNVTLTEDLVKTMTSDLHSTQFPLNNSATFSIHVIDRPIVLDEEGKTQYRYFTITRIHHVVGDGTAINALFTKLFDKTMNKTYIEEIFEKKVSSGAMPEEDMEWRSYLIKKLKEILSGINMSFTLIFLMFQKRLEMIDLRKKDQNALHGPELSGEKVIVWQWENSEKYIPMVKRIKKRFSGVSFPNVCIAALAGSLGSYFKKNGLEVPDYISSFFTIVLNLKKYDLSKPLDLINQSIAVLLEIPLKNSENGIETLNKVKENLNNISYFEALTNNMFIKYIFTLFPIPIRAQMHGSDYTAIISVVPGVKRVEISDGCYCENIIACPPNLKKIGVSICVTTYDNRLTVCLQVDKALLSSQEKAQEIVDDFFKNLETLDAETTHIK